MVSFPRLQAGSIVPGPVTCCEKVFLVLSNYFLILRDWQQADTKYLSGWKQWKKASNKSLKKVLNEVKELSSYLELWRHDIHSIEGIYCLMSISYL